MSTNTPNLLLIKPAQTEQYDVTIFNGNSDKIDTNWKNHKDRLDTLEGEDRTTSNGFVTITTLAGGISPNVAHGLGRIPKHVSFTQATNSGSAAVYITIDDTTLDATNFKFRAFRVDTGAAFVGPLKLMWAAT